MLELLLLIGVLLGASAAYVLAPLFQTGADAAPGGSARGAARE